MSNANPIQIEFSLERRENFPWVQRGLCLLQASVLSTPPLVLLQHIFFAIGLQPTRWKETSVLYLSE